MQYLEAKIDVEALDRQTRYEAESSLADEPKERQHQNDASQKDLIHLHLTFNPEEAPKRGF